MASMREMIEQRAYELFLKRGGVHGYHMEDWYQAEQEIAAGTAESTTVESPQPAAQKKEAAAPARKPPLHSRPAFYNAKKRK
jgi:hypothetical protein